MIGAAVCRLIGHRWTWRPKLGDWLVQYARCSRCGVSEERTFR